jgi:tRNA modification GTPase
VGKSSLLNALLREERAIVTPIPGTTRDIIEETVGIHGIPLRLRDTAGLRSAAEAIEAEGVRRTRESLAQADLVIWVVDGSEPIGEEDLAILPEVGGKKTVVAVNKSDLPPRLSLEDLAKKIPGAPLIPISALHGSGMERLQEAIRDLALDGSGETPEGVLLTSLRHKKALEAARDALCRPLSGDGPLFAEFIAFDLKRALESLGEIAGETTSEEVLDRIFSQFCIGK